MPADADEVQIQERGRVILALQPILPLSRSSLTFRNWRDLHPDTNNNILTVIAKAIAL